MFRSKQLKLVQLTLAACFTIAAVLPAGAFICVDAVGHARFEVAAIDDLSPVDQSGHRDEGLPDCPGHHERPCHDFRLGAFHTFSTVAHTTCPPRPLLFAALLPVEDAVSLVDVLHEPVVDHDVGAPPDRRPERIALRI